MIPWGGNTNCYLKLVCLMGLKKSPLILLQSYLWGYLGVFFGILDVFFDYFSMISDICQFRWNLEAVVKYQKNKNISYFQNALEEEKNIDKLEKPVLSHLFRKANNS